MSDLTEPQKKLADLLWNTKIKAKVRRRKQLSDGSFVFYLVVRNTRPIDFRIDPGEFVFKHHEKNPAAPLSPMYINLRNLPQKLVDAIAKILASIKIEPTPAVLSGIPKAALPIAEAYSKITKIPQVEIFDKEDGEAKRSVIQNKNAPKGEGKKLLIIDDLITKGNSKIEAFKIAEKLGYKVIALLVLFDRQEGGVEELEKLGYKVYSAMQLKPTLKYYLDSGKINKNQYEQTMEYLSLSS
ncbi:hypothetical protein HYS94_05255 [Candidatus Daviesbacteria bacterium]|nr:hypothetical protein [Candidatus Daviesbacteria bacterium]MBI4035442.1 hypothetical protein [Candidatus Daviesbacteria bacterium]